jgi:hypothetical protein
VGGTDASDDDTLGTFNFSQIEIHSLTVDDIPVGCVALFLFDPPSRGDSACELITMPRMCDLSV